MAFASSMEHHRRQRVASLASVTLILALLAGCEVGLEQPVGMSPAEPVPVAATAAEGTTTSSSSEVEYGPSGWHAANRKAGSTPQRVERGKLNFVEGYRAGYQLAAQQSKPIMLFFTAEWCRYCHQMAQEAFTHPQVVALSQSFVCVLVDADAEPAVCRQFGVTGYPTIQFVSPRGVPLELVVGKKPGHQVMLAMRAALQSVAHHNEDAQVSR